MAKQRISRRLKYCLESPGPLQMRCSLTLPANFLVHWGAFYNQKAALTRRQNMNKGTSIFILAVALLAPLLMTGAAQNGGENQTIYVVTHVDATPNFAKEAFAILVKEAADSKADPGRQQYDVLQELARPNHFTLFEVWRSRKDFDTYVASSHAKAFREKLQPMLGSPFDERFHALVH